MRIDLLVDCKTILGEGPVWDVQEQRLYWIDSLGCAIHRSDARGQQHRIWQLPCEIGSMTLRRSGGALLALRSGLHFFDFDEARLSLVAHPEKHQPQARLNDGKVDREGRFVVGSMDMGEETSIGSMYRFSPDLGLETLAEGFAISNGPCWSVDGATMYFADSAARAIYSYHYGRGGVRDRKLFLDLAGFRGLPDGATVDAEGCLWFAEVFGGNIHRVTPDGRFIASIQLPVLKVTSLCFGGIDLDTLYVTSMARPPLPKYPEDGRLAGSLFSIAGIGVRGLPELRFAG